MSKLLDKIYEDDERVEDMASDLYNLVFEGSKFFAKFTPAKGNGKPFYAPVCRNRNKTECVFNCTICDNADYLAPSIADAKKHILGKSTYCAYILNSESKGRFLVLDLDAHNEDDNPKDVFKNARVLAKTAAGFGLKTFMEKSYSGKGAHVWIFFSEMIEGWKLRALGNLIVEKSDIKMDVEVFPKQDTIKQKNKPSGNNIKLFLNGKSLIQKNRTVFVNYRKDNLPKIHPEKVLKSALSGRVTIQVIDKILAKNNIKQKPEQKSINAAISKAKILQPKYKSKILTHRSNNDKLNKNIISFTVMMLYCAFMEHCYDVEKLHYDEWVILAQLLVNCSTGREEFHNISKNDPRYSWEESEKLLNNLQDKRRPSCSCIKNKLGFKCPDSCWPKDEKLNKVSPLDKSGRLKQDELIRHIKPPFKSVEHLVSYVFKKYPYCESKKIISSIITEGLLHRGSILKSSESQDVFVFFDKRSKKGYFFIESSFIFLLQKFSGLNPADSIFKFTMKELELEANEHKTVDIHRLAYCNPNDFNLCISNGNGKYYYLDGENIQRFDNGTDKIYFADDNFPAPWKRIKYKSGTLFKILFKNCNFGMSEEDHLEGDECRALYILVFIAIFFRSILPTMPILLLYGDHGSGKSMALRLLTNMLFGKSKNIAAPPNKKEDYIAAMTNHPIAIFDNISSFPKSIADLLCVGATGGEVPMRKLYTNNELATFTLKCVLMMSSKNIDKIPDDLADRMLPLTLLPLEEGTRIAESKILEEVDKLRNELWSELLDILNSVVKALKETKDRSYNNSFRMADFAEFCLRVASNIDLTYFHLADFNWDELFSRVQQEQVQMTGDRDIFLDTLDIYLTNTYSGEKLKCRELYRHLLNIANQHNIPNFKDAISSSRSLSSKLSSNWDYIQEKFGGKKEMENNEKSYLYEFKQNSSLPKRRFKKDLEIDEDQDLDDLSELI